MKIKNWWAEIKELIKENWKKSFQNLNLNYIQHLFFHFFS